MNDYLWYCAYGSNICFDRFILYIRGGTAPFVNRSFPGCTDKRLPVETTGFDITHQLYFPSGYRPGRPFSSWKEVSDHHHQRFKGGLAGTIAGRTCRLSDIAEGHRPGLYGFRSAGDDQRSTLKGFSGLKARRQAVSMPWNRHSITPHDQGDS